MLLMKKYQGPSVVNAREMALSEYSDFKGWQREEGEYENELGYIVEYLDNNKANTPMFTHHVSWVNKQSFESLYTAVDVRGVYLVHPTIEETRQHCCRRMVVACTGVEKAKEIFLAYTTARGCRTDRPLTVVCLGVPSDGHLIDKVICIEMVS